MTKLNNQMVNFNLWFNPWIDLERKDGTLERQGIAGTLLHAPEYQAIFSTSPLEVVGIHRLLIAILQDMLRPVQLGDLQSLWQAGTIPPELINQFGDLFANRFDLFSLDQPFLQSSDILMYPNDKGSTKTVAYLALDFPSGTAVNHYRHVYDGGQIFCPVCCARGLVVIPAFATSGGSGIKPSINGVPPLYVLPGGHSLFESLAASLVLPPYQPSVRDREEEYPWWRNEPIIEKGSEKLSVSYIESLVFPARRMRLHPVTEETQCTRCGEQITLGVREITFEMGISRPKDAPFWRDPFVAYYLRHKNSPAPLRPSPGKAVWREFGSLFLSVSGEPSGKNQRIPLRPSLVEQLAWLEDSGVGPKDGCLDFRCIGMRTDMKAKIFEWVDSGFNVPFSLLQSSTAGLDVVDALGFSSECEYIMADKFKRCLNENIKKGERHIHAKETMQTGYWMALADPFRLFIADLADAHTLSQGQRRERCAETIAKWYRLSINIARRELEDALQQLASDGHNLRVKFQCLEEFNKTVYGKLKKIEGVNEV